MEKTAVKNLWLPVPCRSTRIRRGG